MPRHMHARLDKPGRAGAVQLTCVATPHKPFVVLYTCIVVLHPPTRSTAFPKQGKVHLARATRTFPLPVWCGVCLQVAN
uniref:Predicted protein n=1 Tax=Hordeum vulgare subsp. vulgare TaxID=112509 RepID=F2E363_HORVV|nr:predicted protein [Hordeum vulgare subsp. vulgare]